MTGGCLRQRSHEVHCDTFPSMSRDGDGLKQSRRGSLVVLTELAHDAVLHICSDVFSKASPPEVTGDQLLRLADPHVTRKGAVVKFVEDLGLEHAVIGDDETAATVEEETISHFAVRVPIWMVDTLAGVIIREVACLELCHILRYGLRW